MHQLTRHLLLIIVLASTLILAAHTGARAAGASITLSVSSGPPTSYFKVNGTGFGASEKVIILFDTTQVGTGKTDNAGLFTKSVRVPASATPGTHTIQATGQSSELTASNTFFVQTNWPMFGFGSNGSHFNHYENVLNPTNVSSLTLNWKAYTGLYIDSSPAVVNGVLYIGSDDGHLHAIDAFTGATLWISNKGGGLGSPAVVNGVVYVDSQDKSGHVYLYAFNARTGKILWAIPGMFSESAPIIVNGVIYIGTDDSKVYAFNATTGAYLWSYTTDSGVYSTPAVVNGFVYVSSTDGIVYALNATTGAFLWRYVTGGQVDHSSPSVVNGVIYVGTANNLYALNATTGISIWIDAIGKNTIPSLAVANGVVYYGSTTLYAFDATTGAILWTVPDNNDFYFTVAVANGVVYTVSPYNSTIIAFNAMTGSHLWSYTAGGYIFTSPVIVNGEVYFGSQDHYVYAFGVGGMKY